MAQITIEEIYRGEKYNVMSVVIADYVARGRPSGYDEKTWLELLIVKYSIEAAHKKISEGDSVSTMVGVELPPFCESGDVSDND